VEIALRIPVMRRFSSISIERLFGNLSAEEIPEMQTWIEYITK